MNDFFTSLTEITENSKLQDAFPVLKHKILHILTHVFHPTAGTFVGRLLAPSATLPSMRPANRKHEGFGENQGSVVSEADCQLSTVTYSHRCALSPGILTSLEAFHEHIVPLNTSEAQLIRTL